LVDKSSSDEEISHYNASLQKIPEKHLWRCYHSIPGFSMRLKLWGWVLVENLTDVAWRDDAFDNLVLPDKDRIFHLVKNYGNSFSDFIDDKSGGLIFLLHGPTGQGKTFSAEAVAESLHRPLYSVSMGELGTTPAEIEKKLRNILDLANQWNAVLLLDEADIFMEARDSMNVERNAMISIFLRILEYHSGVMFLTTNRVKSFDPAFFSRISMAIKYEPMTKSNRKAIWSNLLKAAKVDYSSFDLEKLANYEINGRNMKTAVRLGQTNAIGYNRPLVQDDIEQVLKSATIFNNEIGIY
jgi:SpoVK/Ycf46/Vps4 family AAA+-type ATPase